MALHALSKYGAATFTRAKKAAHVTIQSSGAFYTKFQVNNDNQLLLQRVTLPTVPGDYTAKVAGEGCVYLQVRLGQRRWWWEGRDHPPYKKSELRQANGQVPEKEMRELRVITMKRVKQTPVFNVPPDILEI